MDIANVTIVVRSKDGQALRAVFCADGSTVGEAERVMHLVSSFMDGSGAPRSAPPADPPAVAPPASSPPVRTAPVATPPVADPVA